jgi:hypothetical protein
MSAIDDAITNINAAIVANGNEEITADVLRPLLVELANAVETITGDPVNLTTSVKTNLVAAINSLKTITDGLEGLVIKTGTTDPNVTTDFVPKLGYFYARYSGSTLLSFWQYNGYEWIQVISQAKTILTTTDGNYNVQANDYTVIYEDGVTSTDISIGDPSQYENRILKIVNRDSNELDILDSGYINYSALAVTTIPANSSITLQSDGASWNLI